MGRKVNGSYGVDRGWLLVASLIMITGFGCASGRAMTDTELSEYADLESKLSAKRSTVEAKKIKLRKAFSKASIGTSGNKAKLCGLKNSIYKTGKVPLVYGAKKRVVFSARSTATQCRDARVEVKK